jgi:hypothetical protein
MIREIALAAGILAVTLVTSARAEESGEDAGRQWAYSNDVRDVDDCPIDHGFSFQAGCEDAAEDLSEAE